MTETVHTAPAVLRITQAPIRNGAVAVAGGRVVAVGVRDRVLGSYPGAEVVAWDGALLPGLVNAHTHLQYTSFNPVGTERHASYVEWSARFVEEYESRAATEDWAATARRGLAAGLASGTTCFGDVVTDEAALSLLVEEDVPGVAYFELIGVDEAAWARGVADETERVLVSAPQLPTSRVGLSPHAPYSVDEPVLRAASALARRLGRRIHIHLAESDTEDSYYRHGTGALAERVASRVGRPWSILGRGGTGLGAAEFAASCDLLGPDSHVAHGVYLGEEGRALVSGRGTSVALCPRSNLAVGIDPPPVAAFFRQECLIAVGTDSLASAPSLDLMEDVALLRQLATGDGYVEPDLDRRLLEAATIGGARALGLDHDLGSLRVGKRADFAIFDVDTDVPDLERALVATGAGRCVATYVGGIRRF